MSASFMESVAKTETTKNSFPLRYIWSDDSAHAFQQVLASNKIQSLVSEFVSTTSMNDNNSINTASEKLGNIFSQAAEMSLKNRSHETKINLRIQSGSMVIYSNCVKICSVMAKYIPNILKIQL